MFKSHRNPLIAMVTAQLALVCTLFAASAAMAGGMYGKKADAPKDIVTTAVQAGQFKTLAAALEAAGLVETLQGEGPFTVFAPTDAAFAKLPEGTVEMLLKAENRDKLTAILTYHVVPGRVTSGEVVNLSSAKTVNGRSVAVTVADGGVNIDNARVVKADIEASNGIIHVIDAVVLPN